MIIYNDEYCVIVDKVFDSKLVDKMNLAIEVSQRNGELHNDTSSNRYTMIKHPFFEKMSLILSVDIQKCVDLYFDAKKIKPSYSFISKYKEGGILEKHLDRIQCEFTASYSLFQTDPWPIYIEGNKYILKENQLILFKGREHLHYRESMPEGSRHNQVLFHYVYDDFDQALYPVNKAKLE